MRKEKGQTINWRKIVAGLVIAGVASLGGNFAKAANYERFMFGNWATETAWNPNAPVGGPTTGDDAFFGAAGPDLVTVGGESIDNLFVAGRGWSLGGGSLTINNDLTVDGGSLRLMDNAGDFYTVTNGTVIQNSGILTVETNASLISSSTTLNAGTLEIVMGADAVDTIAIPGTATTTLGAGGGTFMIDDGITLNYQGAIDGSVANGNFTKTGLGTAVFTGSTNLGTGTGIFGTDDGAGNYSSAGTTTYDAGSTLTAGKVIIGGTGTVLEMKAGSTNEIGTAGAPAADDLSIVQGGKVIVETGAVFNNEKPGITFGGSNAGDVGGTFAIVNTTGGPLTAANGSDMTVTSGTAILDVDAGIDLLHIDTAQVTGAGGLTKMGDGTINFAGKVDLGGTVTFNATTDATLFDTISSQESGGVAGFKAGSIDAQGNLLIDDGASVELTGAISVAKDLTLGTNAGGAALPTLAGTTLTVGGVYTDTATSTVTLTDEAVFETSSTINGAFTAPNLEAKDNVVLTVAATSTYAGGTSYTGGDGSTLSAAGKDLAYTGAVDLSAGNNNLTANTLTVGGLFSDSTTSTTILTGEAVFKAALVPQTSQINGTFTTVDMRLGDTVAGKEVVVNVNAGATVDITGDYLGGSHTTFSAGDQSFNNVQEFTLRDAATFEAADLRVAGSYSDKDTSMLNVANQLTFADAQGTIVKGQLGNSATLDVLAGDGAGQFYGLVLQKGFDSQSITSGDLTLSAGTYRTDFLDVKGDFIDKGATTEVNGVSLLSNASITGDAMIGGVFKSIGLDAANILIKANASVDAQTGNITTGDLTMLGGNNAIATAGNLLVKGEFVDNADSDIVVRQNLTFTNGAIVKGNILGTDTDNAALNVYSGDAASADPAKQFQALTVKQGFNSKSITSGDLTFGSGAYNTGILDVHGNFDDMGAETNVTDDLSPFPNAMISGDATVAGQFTSIGLDAANITAKAGAVVNAQGGDIATVGNLNLQGNAMIATAENLRVDGIYSDTADSVINIGKEFQFTGSQAIASKDFNAETVNVLANQDLTLAKDAVVNTGSASSVEGNLFLNDNSRFGSVGNLVTNTGSVVVKNGTATLNGDFDNQGSLVVGDYTTDINGDKIAVSTGNLAVAGNWVGNNGGQLGFTVDSIGNVGDLTIAGVASGTTEKIALIGETGNPWDSKNLNQLGQNLYNSKHVLVSADGTSEDTAFSMDLSNNTSKWGFSLSPVNEGGRKNWELTSTIESMTPDVSSFFLANIIGFDLPRAQNVSGPWVRTKGGNLYDNVAQFDKISFQMLQIGWDKSFKAANGNGNWFAGIFLEGDWMYGNGIYYRNRAIAPEAAGWMKSSHRGMGTGLYISRGFNNGWYCDLIGRINLYDSDVSMTATPGMATNYKGSWTDQILSMGFEIGKTFDSRDGRWSFNPYNRFLYNSAPGNNYAISYDDINASNTLVRTHAADAWTNQLGARLYYNSLNRGKSLGNVYFGMDYYQGLSGAFALDMIDAGVFQGNKAATWDRAALARTKNDLSYGMGTIGATFLPRENFSVSTQLDMLFGDVSGAAVTLAARYSY